MNYLVFELLPLVTADTEVPLGTRENRRVIGAVRVVTHGAFVDIRMCVLHLQVDLCLAVAVQAELGLVLLKSQCADESMWPMTGGAIACRHGRVGTGHIDVDFFVTALACACLVESGAFPKLSLGGRGQQIEAKQHACGSDREPRTAVSAVGHGR
jgi:hypothetical protein